MAMADDEGDAGDRYRFKPVLDRPTIEVMEPEASPALLEADAKAVLMRAVCGDPTITNKQMRAAIALLPFLYPKLSVADHANGRKQPGYGDRLEAARSRAAKVVTFALSLCSRIPRTLPRARTSSR